MSNLYEPLLLLDLDVETAAQTRRRITVEANREQLDRLIGSLEAAGECVQQLDA